MNGRRRSIKPAPVRRKARRGRPRSLEAEDKLLIAALWMKYLAPMPVTRRSDYALAKALSACREPAVRSLLGTSSPGTLRNRLRKVRNEILNPYWNFLVLVARWAKEVGLSCRSPDELQGMKRLPPVTPQQLDLACRHLMVAFLLRYRLEPSEFEWVRRQLFGEG
jgi:hypothetical protein